MSPDDTKVIRNSSMVQVEEPRERAAESIISEPQGSAEGAGTVETKTGGNPTGQLLVGSHWTLPTCGIIKGIAPA
jgi:hypothetical protein